MIASFISRLFEPMVILILLAVLGGYHAGLTGTGLTNYFLFIFSFAILPAALFRFWYSYKKGVDWDIRDRKKRILPLLFQIIFLLFGLVIILQWNNTALTAFYRTLLIWLIGFFLVTTRWKISGHASTLAIATGSIISWYGWSWWPILLTVPLVSWARVKTKDHTILQVIAGAAYSWGLFFFL